MKPKNSVQSAIDHAFFPNENEKYLLHQKINRRLNSLPGEGNEKRKFSFAQVLSFFVLSSTAIAILLFAGFQSGLINQQSGSTKKQAEQVEHSPYQFQIVDSSVKTFLENPTSANDKKNVLEYKISFKDIGAKTFIWTEEEREEIHFDIFAKEGLKDLMVDTISGPTLTFSNSNIESYNGTLLPPLKDGELWTYQWQYVIKEGVDPNLALKHAREAEFLVQVGARLIQKTDLSTMETTLLNESVLTLQERIERSKLREGMDINRSSNFITQFLGKNYTEMTSTTETEKIWRYDIGAANGYTFEVSPYMADIKGLQEGKIKKQIYFTINKDKNINSITVYYLNENDQNIHRYTLTSEGEEDVVWKE